MKIDFQYVSALQYEVRALRAQVKAHQSGEAYRAMKEDYERQLREKDRMIAAQKRELAAAHRDVINMRRHWMQVFEDMEKEHQKECSKAAHGLSVMTNRAFRAEALCDQWHDKWKEQQAALYAALTEVEELKERNRKLTAQVNRDFENSSLPSSLQGPKRKKIPNSRERTGRKPGGQPGHKGHCRKRHVPTETHELPAPANYADNPDYYETGRIIRKQKLVIQMTVKVIEYTAKEYRSRSTGARVHAPFPSGFVNEVNYDGTVKALAFLLSNECNVSHGKIRKLLSELTGGKVEISDGMINNLCKDFSFKSEPEKKKILSMLMSSPVMNADFTNANVNGQSAQVLVLASPVNGAALYMGREKKGHEGIKGTPLEDYVGIVVHDHDKSFYSYGTGHQECMQHNCRYLIDSKENEPDLEWNHKMHALIQEMLHYRNGLEEKEGLDPVIVAAFEARYDEILDKAEEEYKDTPPSKYYREGYNLSVRLREYKESELRFLHDKKVPANNSLCERLARVYKRKQKQATVLRSQRNLGYICDSLSTVHLLRSNTENVYQEIAAIFERRRPPKPQKEVLADGME